MSRICIKNLSNTVNEKQLTNIFNQKGEITDIKIIKTKDGKSRRLAFIGYRTEVQATEAFKHFNNTFIGLSKIIVEIAKKYNHNETLLKSKHNKNKKNLSTDSNNNNNNNSKHEIKDDSDKIPLEPKDSKKKEFIEIMKNRKTKSKWNNDDISGINEEGSTSNRNITNKHNDDDDDSSNDNSSDSEEDDDNNNQNKTNNDKSNDNNMVVISDLDYLKSKIKYLSSDSESSSDNDNDDKEGSENEIVTVAANKDLLTQQKTHRNNNDHITNNNDNNDCDNNDDNDVNDNDIIDSTIEDSSRLFVKNLPFSCTEEELSELFNKYGNREIRDLLFKLSDKL